MLSVTTTSIVAAPAAVPTVVVQHAVALDTGPVPERFEVISAPGAGARIRAALPVAPPVRA